MSPADYSSLGPGDTRPSDQERDQVLALLQEAYIAGRIDLAELEERQEKALSARYSREFIELLDGLPEGGELMRRLGAPVAAQETGGMFVPASYPVEPQRSLVVFGEKTLAIAPGQSSLHCRCVLGEQSMDLRGNFAPGVTVELAAPTVLGETTIYVPRGVRVINQTKTILAESKVKPEAMGDGSAGTLLLTGTLVLAELSVRLG